MNPMASINTSGIPEDVLLLITGIVIVVTILCAVLVGAVHYRDRAKEKRSNKYDFPSGHMDPPMPSPGVKSRSYGR